MAFTVGSVVMLARDQHPAFDERRHPDSLCWRFLTEELRSLVNATAEVAPRALTPTLVTYSLPLAVFANGVGAPRQIIDAELRPVSRWADHVRVPMTLLPAKDRRTRSTRGPWGWLEGTVLYLGGVAEDWTAYDMIELRTVPDIAQLVANATTVPLLVDDAKRPLAMALAAFLAQRHAAMPDGKDFSPKRMQDSASEARAEFLARLTNQKRANTFMIRNATGY